jgi:L-lactate dehydrogenase complex protein LldG
MASSAKENILKKIRQGLSHPVPLPFPKSEGNNSVFLPADDDLEVVFAREFTKLLGKFAYCANEEDMKKQVEQLIAEKQWDKVYCVEDKLKNLLNHTSNNSTLSDCDASITSCEYLIARTGTIAITSASQSGRTVSVYAPIHICIAYTNQLVYDVKDALQPFKDQSKTSLPSLITLATGPSRTADIEKTLVVGVHGPKEVYVFLVESPNPMKMG